MSCKLNCLLCCFNLCVSCGFRKCLINNHAFFPPKCSYDFLPINDNQNSQNKFKQFQFVFKENNEEGFQAIQNIDQINVSCYKISPDLQCLSSNQATYSSEKAQFLPVIHLRYLNKATHRNFVIIHSHGNSTDMGHMMDIYLDLVQNLRVDLIAYDYSGYGLASNHKMGDQQMIQNVLSVYQFAVEGLKYSWQQIILYGQSIGTGPCVFLASVRERPIGGLILHSSFSSGLKIFFKQENEFLCSDQMNETCLEQSDNSFSSNFSNLSGQSSPALRASLFEQNLPPMQKSSSNKQKPNGLNKYDFFPNFQMIKYVNCPIYFMHGDQDQVVPISQMWHLISNVKKSTPYLKQVFQGADHNTIENDQRYRKEYFYRLRQYLTSVNNLQKAKSQTDLLREMQASYWESFEHLYKQELYKISQEPSNRSSNVSSNQVIIDLIEKNNYQLKINPQQTEKSNQNSFSFNPSKNKFENQQSFGASVNSQEQLKETTESKQITIPNSQQNQQQQQQQIQQQNISQKDNPDFGLVQENSNQQLILTEQEEIKQKND
ncbi:hypothetical protein ABPG72_018530 [Tetrahymena utriculariae]